MVGIERSSVISDDNGGLLLEIIKAIFYAMLTIVPGLCEVVYIYLISTTLNEE